MSVKLRKKKGTKKDSLYLDIYDSSGRHYEFLKDLYLEHPKNQKIKERNKEILLIAEEIRAKRELELIGTEYNYIPKFKKNINFLTYWQNFLNNYNNKDKRLVKCSFDKFNAFLDKKKFKGFISGNQITEELCREFKHYLDNILHGESPYNYFQKFKRVIRQAFREKILNNNPTEFVTNVKTVGLKKDILSIKEIQILANTDIINKDIRNAFFFCLNTGLRFCDVYQVKWRNISDNQIKIIQSKTKNSSKNSFLVVDLNRTAQKLIGNRKEPDDLVFNLPVYNSCRKALSRWVKRASIQKHITWHCARHSFGSNLLNKNVVGTDIYTTKELLGQSTIQQTMVYVRALDEEKKKAVNKLPETEFIN
jgi:integrase/recombinase XerD